MKFISISILVICLLTATFSNWLLITSFSINQTYIATHLCINRNNPNSHCNGHCYLCKQLGSNEKQDAATGSSKEKFEVQLFFSHPSFIDANTSKNISSLTIPASQQFSPQQFTKTCFHPPCA